MSSASSSREGSLQSPHSRALSKEVSGDAAHDKDSLSSSPSRDIEKGDPKLEQFSGQDHERRANNSDAYYTKIVEEWSGPDDPENPINWPLSTKYLTTVLYSTLTFCMTFASSVFSTATIVTSQEFGVSEEVMTLGTSLFVLVSCSTNSTRDETRPCLTVLS